jgi:hypothetical protein
MRDDNELRLQEEGILLAAKGVTSLPELMRVLKKFWHSKKGLFMIKKLLFALVGLSITAAHAQSIIVERDSLRAMYEFLTPEDYHHHTLIIFDIDNTLAYPEKVISNDPWSL